MELVHLESCGSTQDEALARLVHVDAGAIVAVTCDRQEQGRGREGRSWQQPPCPALFVSVGIRGPLAPGVLEELPARVSRALIGALDELADTDAARVVWKGPNDLVDRDGAKLGGVLVDARTTGAAVDHVVVGAGINVEGPAFTTADGRRATTLERALGRAAALAPLRRTVVEVLRRELEA